MKTMEGRNNCDLMKYFTHLSGVSRISQSGGWGANLMFGNFFGRKLHGNEEGPIVWQFFGQKLRGN